MTTYVGGLSAGAWKMGRWKGSGGGIGVGGVGGVGGGGGGGEGGSGGAGGSEDESKAHTLNWPPHVSALLPVHGSPQSVVGAVSA